MFAPVSLKVDHSGIQYTLRGRIDAIIASFPKRLTAGVLCIQSHHAPHWLECSGNSIQVAIRLWISCVFLRAASLASDERENVKNRGNVANVRRNARKSSFHAGVIVRQGLDMRAHIPQPVNFYKKVLESRSHRRTIGRRACCARHCGGRLCSVVNLKAQVFKQPQRCCLAQEGKTQPQ